MAMSGAALQRWLISDAVLVQGGGHEQEALVTYAKAGVSFMRQGFALEAVLSGNRVKRQQYAPSLAELRMRAYVCACASVCWFLIWPENTCPVVSPASLNRIGFTRSSAR